MTADQIIPQSTEPEQNSLLTRAELIERFNGIGMTSSVALVAIDEDGTEHPANLGYSSDLKAMAIMTYGPYGEAGERGITSWYPLPTRTTHYDKGFGASTLEKYADEGKPIDGTKQKAGQTLYRLVQK